MEDLRRLYRGALRVRLDALGASLAAIGAQPQSGDDALSPEEGAIAARRIAHALRGSGGTYGFPEISAAAAAVEEATADALVQRLETLMRLLRDTIDGADT